MARIRWKLREVIARYKLKHADIGGLIGRSGQTISNWASDDYIPGIGGRTLEKLIESICELSGENISIFDLIEEEKMI